ncbi:MAG: hypothetical protein M9888_04675 [Chitinophagales bacterium]|nr:hypothetical protein [Chitinophagales bacterium]
MALYNDNQKLSIVLLSDLWGIYTSDWWLIYKNILGEKFKIIELDSRTIAKVPEHLKNEKDIHHFFIEEGIQNAVKYISQSTLKEVAIIAFSIGGTIAWQALLNNQEVHYLFAISSTRLRYERIIPKVETLLFYGEKDIYQPDKRWYQQHQISPIIFQNESHDFYMKSQNAVNICNTIINTIQTKTQ